MTSPSSPSLLSAEAFPVTFRIFSGKTGEVLWQKTVERPPSGELISLDIPGYADTEHFPVRVEIQFADGTTEIGGME
jgi:hypothetical protein